MSSGKSRAHHHHDIKPSDLLIAADTGQTLDVALLTIELKEGEIDEGHPGHSKTGFNRGTTPLMAAAKSGHAHVVAMLLKAGAKVNVEDDEYWNAAHYAAFSGHADVCAVLVSHGVDLTVVSMYEKATPVGFARYKRFKRCTHLLEGSLGIPKSPAFPTFNAKDCVKYGENGLTKLSNAKEGTLMFRYRISEQAHATLTEFLNDLKAYDPKSGHPWPATSFPLRDTLLKGSGEVTMEMRSNFLEHRARQGALMEEGNRTVLRTSSISSMQHIIVLKD